MIIILGSITTSNGILGLVLRICILSVLICFIPVSMSVSFASPMLAVVDIHPFIDRVLAVPAFFREVREPLMEGNPEYLIVD